MASVANPSKSKLPAVIPLLAVGTFLMCTTEFMIAGLLAQMSDDFGVRPSQIGLLITAFAIGMIVGAPGDGHRNPARPQATHPGAGAGDLRCRPRHRRAQRVVRATRRRPGADRSCHRCLLVGRLGGCNTARQVQPQAHARSASWAVASRSPPCWACRSARLPASTSAGAERSGPLPPWRRSQPWSSAGSPPPTSPGRHPPLAPSCGLCVAAVCGSFSPPPSWSWAAAWAPSASSLRCSPSAPASPSSGCRWSSSSSASGR